MHMNITSLVNSKVILFAALFYLAFLPGGDFAQEVPRDEAAAERISFWRYEQNQKLGKNAVLMVPFDYRVALFRNRRPLQFHGWSGIQKRFVPDLDDGRALDPEIRDLTPLLRKSAGDFILIGVPERAGLEIDFSREQYAPLAARVDGVLYTVINIVVREDGRIELEGEREERYGEAGDYFHWDVEGVFVLYRK